MSVTCVVCGETFTGTRISEIMADRRDHMEKRHLQARIETDT